MNRIKPYLEPHDPSDNAIERNNTLTLQHQLLRQGYQELGPYSRTKPTYGLTSQRPQLDTIRKIYSPTHNIATLPLFAPDNTKLEDHVKILIQPKKK